MSRLLILRAPHLLLSILVLAACDRETPLTVEELIDRHVRAVGGRSALEAVHTIRFDLHIVDSGSFEVNGIYVAARPGSMRIDIKAGGKHVYTEALDGERAWQWKGKGKPAEASAMAAAALRHGIEMPGHLFGLHELRSRGDRLAAAGREQLNGVEYYRLRLTFVDGESTTLYLDPNSWLITRRRDVRALHPDIDPTPTTIETILSDFRRVGQLMFPFVSAETDLATGKVLEKATVRSITLNSSVSANKFRTL